MGDGAMNSYQSSSSQSSHSCLEGLYALHDELGSGGFGKVKLATHLLTGQKVAIKIIDKKQIGDDLPRVRTELEALRHLQHQNICRLYHDIETDDKFYLAMEYCSGGEMFDYIVKKARLEESEARHFFRQLVQAIAYIHSQGYAHRDLKPENLLLTEDLHLKVIDFGLCARPDTMTKPLETCCGSPAYAAPELIQGSPYLGNAADVWSMGVLLYALLVGALPFEDDSMNGLYRKITRGIYLEPDCLSQESKDLLRLMLKTNPRERITIQELLKHKWLNTQYSQPVKWNTIYDRNVVDEDVSRELAYHHSVTHQQMIRLIKEWKFDYLTATYFILLQLKRRGQPFLLPGPRASRNDVCNVINSPTIHASLDNDLDRSGLEEETGDEEKDREVRFKLPPSPGTSPAFAVDQKSSNLSYKCAVLGMGTLMSGRSPQQRILPSQSPATPSTPTATSRQINRRLLEWYETEKENKMYALSLRAKGNPIRVSSGDDSCRPRSVYATPARPALKNVFYTNPASSAAPTPQGSRSRASSSERPGHTSKDWAAASPASPSSCESRTPRSAMKTPRLRTRMFASLERKADRVINMLTPRKIRQDEPARIKNEKNLVNISITSSDNPELIREELIHALQQQNIKHEVNGWKISGGQKDSMGHSLTFQLEVVLVESLDRVGVRRRRLNGNGFLYKKVCESILQMANI